MPAARPLFFESTQLSEPHPVVCGAVCDYFLYTTVALHQLILKFQCCRFVSAFDDNVFQHFALMIKSPPRLTQFAINLHEDLVHVALSFVEHAQLLNTLPSYFSSKHRANPAPPISNSFVAHVDNSLMHLILDIPKRERKSDVKHQRKADYLRAGFKVLERGRFFHF